MNTGMNSSSPFPYTSLQLSHLVVHAVLVAAADDGHAGVTVCVTKQMRYR